MSTSSLLQLLVRCPRCEQRNVVDLRKQGVAKRARCGRCGEPLPRRLPAPLLLMIMSGLVVLAGLSHFGLEALRSRRATSRRAQVEQLLAENRPDEAAGLLPEPRAPASEDARLAERVAASLAAPILAADSDPASGPATVEAAIDAGDRLIEAHERDLPELLRILDDPLRRLQARSIAFGIVKAASDEASRPSPDVARVERELERAALETLESSPDVAAAVESLSHGIRSRAVLARARSLAARRPEDARQLLLKTAARIPPPEASGLHDLAPAPPDPPAGTLLQHLQSLRDAVEKKDLARLQSVVHLRADASWDDSAREELDREVRRACMALASLGSQQAASAPDPEARAQALLAGMTCDEILPADFVTASRRALAETLVEAARRGGSLEDALLAWEGVSSPTRDRDVANLACMAEGRGDHALAVLAWSRVSAQGLARMPRCGEEPVAALPPARLPEIDYPSPGM